MRFAQGHQWLRYHKEVVFGKCPKLLVLCGSTLSLAACGFVCSFAIFPMSQCFGLLEQTVPIVTQVGLDKRIAGGASGVVCLGSTCRFARIFACSDGRCQSLTLVAERGPTRDSRISRTPSRLPTVCSWPTKHQRTTHPPPTKHQPITHTQTQDRPPPHTNNPSNHPSDHPFYHPSN